MSTCTCSNVVVSFEESNAWSLKLSKVAVKNHHQLFCFVISASYSAGLFVLFFRKKMAKSASCSNKTAVYFLIFVTTLNIIDQVGFFILNFCIQSSVTQTASSEVIKPKAEPQEQKKKTWNIRSVDAQWNPY